MGGDEISVNGSTESEENGRFFLSGLTPTNQVHIRAVNGEWVSIPQKIELPVVGRNDLVLELQPGAALFGTVVDHEHRPIPDIRVTALRIPMSRVGVERVVSDRAGRFVLRRLPPGPHRLVLERADEVQRRQVLIESVFLYGDDAARSSSDDLADVIIGDNGEIILTNNIVAQIRTTDTVENIGGADDVQG